MKGKVACEISSAEELTLTELIFNGVLKDVKVEEMVSLLSCFVWQEKLQDASKPREELELLFTQLQDTARRVAKVQLECKVLMELIAGSFLSNLSCSQIASLDFRHIIVVICFDKKYCTHSCPFGYLMQIGLVRQIGHNYLLA